MLLPWLTGGNKNPLLYDTTWGGLVVQNGLASRYANFGNTWYNDHHFQYGERKIRMNRIVKLYAIYRTFVYKKKNIWIFCDVFTNKLG